MPCKRRHFCASGQVRKGRNCSEPQGKGKQTFPRGCWEDGNQLRMSCIIILLLLLCQTFNEAKNPTLQRPSTHTLKSIEPHCVHVGHSHSPLRPSETGTLISPILQMRDRGPQTTWSQASRAGCLTQNPGSPHCPAPRLPIHDAVAEASG